ncbi:MAG: hypothetical protein ABH842_02815 [Candidatus Micrarchaeota archaeon]
MTKRLLVFPEHHSTTRREEAITAARFSTARGFSTKLFLEGVFPDEKASLERTLGVPLVATEHPRLKHTAGLAFIQTISEFYNFMLVMNTADDATLLQYMRRFDPHVDLDNLFETLPHVQDFFRIAVSHTFVLAHKSGFNISDSADSIIQEVSSDYRRLGLPILASILKRYIEQYGSDDLRASAKAVFDEVSAFFIPRGIPINGVNEGIALIDLTVLTQAAAASDITGFMDRITTINLLLNFGCRELYLALVITKEDFEQGVLLVGHDHLRFSLPSVLSGSGITMDVK